MFRIGVMTDSFRLPFREALSHARRLGAEGVQCYAVEGELAPENLDGAARRRMAALARDEGLVISALCGDMGGHGFQLAEENAWKLARSKLVAELAADLGVQVVTTHAGVIPEDRESSAYAIMVEAVGDIARRGAELGVAFAIETGPEPATRLARFIDDVGARGLGVNLDPANLVMVLGADPVEAARILGPRILHTHAKDGRHLADCDPVAVYDAFAKAGVEGFPFGRYFCETPLGEGAVPWREYLSALSASGYEGFLTVEREVGDDPEADIAAAVSFLRSLGASPARRS